MSDMNYSPWLDMKPCAECGEPIEYNTDHTLCVDCATGETAAENWDMDDEIHAYMCFQKFLHDKGKNMSKMKNNEVRFMDGDKLVTGSPVELGWASVDQPDEDYCTYSVEMIIPKDTPWVDELFQRLLTYENAMRKEQGLDPVDAASPFLTRDGDPRVDEDGNWRIRASGKSNLEPTDKFTEPFTKNKPKVYDAAANLRTDLSIWSGDICNVAFSVGFWRSGTDYGTKLYLKDVQQVKAGPGKPAQNPFEAMAGETAGVKSDGIPF